ncbi:MAG TPA: 8-oxo-dGTP diphosphatase MutT [Nitrospiraceae bacterium]|nr:8-oxo-dGTP diphosphatase MutT [Nitrospiraceae bacterium]
MKHTIQVAAGLVKKDHRYLITKRPAGVHLGGLWEFPGGKRETGESLEECLQRELKEELGIDITPGSPFHIIRHEYSEKVVELHFFYCTLQSGEPQALGCEAWRWVAVKDLPNFEFPPADRPVIDMLQRTSGTT